MTPVRRDVMRALGGSCTLKPGYSQSTTGVKPITLATLPGSGMTSGRRRIQTIRRALLESHGSGRLDDGRRYRAVRPRISDEVPDSSDSGRRRANRPIENLGGG